MTKQDLYSLLQGRMSDLTALSDSIWGFAELSLQEYRSAACLADFLENEGFTVERGIAGIETAFCASFGSGKPVIGLLAEYDALDGLQQEVLCTPAATAAAVTAVVTICWVSAL